MKLAATTVFRKQCRRRNFAGHCHFITFSCYRRQPFLRNDRACTWLATSLTSACKCHDFELNAYVFMHDHVHLLVRPNRETYDISSFLTSIKRPVTRDAKRYLLSREDADQRIERFLDIQPNGQAHFRFWQRGGGYDRNIWSDEEFQEKLAYIHDNPVRRGLCKAAEEWKWSSAGDYVATGPGPIPIVIV